MNTEKFKITNGGNMAELFDCWFVEGELDNNLNSRCFGFYASNNKYKKTKVKHNVSEEEAIAWYNSIEVHQMAQESYNRGLDPSYYWTTATDDEV